MTNEPPTAVRRYKVLFFDCFSYRHVQFRVKAENPEKDKVWQRHVHNLAEFNAALLEKDFEVIFIPGFVDNNTNTKGMVDALIALPECCRPKLLVMHGTADIVRIVPTLRDNGYLVAHVPWDFVNPMLHERLK